MIEVNQKNEAILGEWSNILGFITQDIDGNYIYYMGINCIYEEDEYKFISFCKDMIPSVPSMHDFNNGMSIKDIFNKGNNEEELIVVFDNKFDFENSFKFTFNINC